MNEIENDPEYSAYEEFISNIIDNLEIEEDRKEFYLKDHEGYYDTLFDKMWAA